MFRRRKLCAPRHTVDRALAETFKVARRRDARADPRRAVALGAVRLRSSPRSSAQRIGGLAPAAAAARDAPRAPAARGRMMFYALDDQHIVRLFEQGLEHVEEAAPRADATARRRERLHASANCTPSRPSRSKAWTAARKSRCSSAGSSTCAGLEDFSADLMGQRLHVKYDAAKLSASAIAGAVADAGHARVARARRADRRRRSGGATAPSVLRGGVRRRRSPLGLVAATALALRAAVCQRRCSPCRSPPALR